MRVVVGAGGARFTRGVIMPVAVVMIMIMVVATGVGGAFLPAEERGDLHGVGMAAGLN